MTAPLLSPTDISPKIDFDAWLQSPLPANTTSISPNAAYSDFASAVNNPNFSFSLASPPFRSSFPVPTRTIPYMGPVCSRSESPTVQNGGTQLQLGHALEGPVTNLEDIFPFDDPFFGRVEDNMMVQATIHNSCLDLVSDYQDDDAEIQSPALTQYIPTTECTSIDGMDLLDFSLLSQPEQIYQRRVEAILPVVTGGIREIVSDIPSTVNNQPHPLFTSQWTAVSDHDSKTQHNYEQVWDTRVPTASTSAVSGSLAFTKELRPERPKSTRRGVVTKAKHNTFVNCSVNFAGVKTVTNSPGFMMHQRRSLDDDERTDAAIIQQIKPCEKCRKGKRKCKRHNVRFFDLFRMNLHTLKLPCMFLKLEEARLFRLAPNKEHPMRCSDVVYQSLELSRRQYDCVTLCLTQDFGVELVIEVTQFDPQPGDKTAHVWHGETVELPPYCIVGIQQAGRKVMDYVCHARNSILLELLSSANDVTREVLLQADRFQRRSSNLLVKQALDLFAATRIIERDWRICGSETLGIPAILDLKQPGSPKIPVTPVMDGQLDQLVTKSYLLPLRESFLENLQKTIYTGKKEDWFSIFLSTFVFLTHIECLLQHSRRNAKRYGLKRRYNDITLAEKYFEASRIVLAHFHFVANAATPLRLDWKQNDVATAANLDNEQIALIENVLARMEEWNKDGRVRRMRIRHQYEEPGYFCQQMFEERWEATIGKIGIQEEVAV
ncbi:hypothetical protein FKW77_003646 [Venturia effusa]|uniref:Zn(2)-C6 fungal-type domain-containing protein n=1 Tax=Venturia effusa TaxID=50376 RepID=A0A517L134_9PEZI|nr:hypothetical protein FKW77_003646 [Venturia effusa]